MNQAWLEPFNKNFIRSLKPNRGVDFSSNDYLGFAIHAKLQEAALQFLHENMALGSGGSRLLRGNHEEHENLEKFAAKFFRRESCLFFNSGFEANHALFSTLPGRHDLVIMDERIHASVKEGLRSGFAQTVKVKHNDVTAFIQAGEKSQAKRIWLAVEGIYSMDGDIAPVKELLIECERHGWVLIVDEAHSTGVLGEYGRGICENIHSENLITLHTCGKALGLSGALLCLPKILKAYMINYARPFIYSTAPAPLQAALVHRALYLIEEEKYLREKLHKNIFFAREKLSKFNIGGDQHSPIIPLFIDDVVAKANQLQELGFDVRAIRSPTVPKGAERLRISIHAFNTEAEINDLFHSLYKVDSRT